MKIIQQLTAAAFAGLVMCMASAEAVQIASNFTVTNRETGKPIRRNDFEGKIVFLDFFAYWCGPCRTSSPTVEAEIAKYYQKKGGNPQGIEVVVIGVNVESQSPSSTDEFITSVGFKTVADDFGAAGGAWAQFGRGGIPHFVIINGVKGGSHKQWEVLHSDSGFRGSVFYRNLINSIEPAETVQTPEIIVEQPKGSGLEDGTANKFFGTSKVGSRGTVRTFTIRNSGDAPLTGLAITKTGLNTKDFIVTAPVVSTLSPGETTSFKVTFKPTATGTRKAAIRLKSNDSDENPFDIKLTGTAVRK
jgi:thiol-disulfide isomerase/thioredoxin